MVASTMTNLSLPHEARSAVWRVFGAGASPLTERSPFDLIEPIISKRVSSPTQQAAAINEVRSWFEPVGERQRLKPDMRETVAVLILEGIGNDWSKEAVWAVGSIEDGLATRVIRSRWGPEEIGSFVKAALTTLEMVSGSDKVLDAAGIVPSAGVESGKARIPRDAVQREGRLETFRHLNSHGFELVHLGLHPPVGKLIELVINLRPERFKSLIERLDHPVMQARAAYHMVAATRALDHRTPLLWITEDSCDALVALAIEHTLETVNWLDQDIQSSERLGEGRRIRSTDLRPPQDGLDAAAVTLLDDLVDRLAMLDPMACARWIGELLSGTPYTLMQGGGFEKPPRIEQLEKRCTELLARLVHHSWSDDLPVELCAGLCLTPRTTWTRHMAEVAWAVRDVEPARAATLARATLDEHERHIADELARGHVFLNWTDWHDREWIAGLGAALVLSSDELDLLEWASARCRALPLSVWDVEESYQAFSAADRAAQIWFLVAFHAVAGLKQIDRAVDPAAVRALAETVWAHCHFTGQHLAAEPEVSVAAEQAARSAVEFGDPSDLWLLEQARSPRVGPRALWALIDQRKKKAAREGGSDTGCDELVIDEIARAASNRFGDGGQFDLESLHYWGHLWLQLDAIVQARRTAKAIIASPARGDGRGSEVLALKLLTLGADKQRLDPETKDYVASTYRKLWPVYGYTPDAERADRRRVDELLERSGLAAP